MRDRPRLAHAALAAALLFFPFAFLPCRAFADRPVFQLNQGARANLRDKGDVASEFIERLELQWLVRSDWWLIPFGEARDNLDQGLWSRMEAGVELRGRPFAPWKRPLSWITVGSGFQRAWVKPDSDRFEWEGRFLVGVPLPWAVRSKPVEVYALNEYTVDLEEGQGIRNEMGAGFKIPLPGWARWDPFLTLGWRHVDLIHELDDDQFEGSLDLSF